MAEQQTPEQLAAQLHAAQQYAKVLQQAKACNKRYYDSHKEACAARHARWYEANKERLREHYRLKAAERRAAARQVAAQDAQQQPVQPAL